MRTYLNSCKQPKFLRCQTSTAVALLSILSWSVAESDFPACADATAPNNTLSGKVSAENHKKNDDSLKLGIQDVIDSAHHLQLNLRDIIYEVTRQNYVSIMQPNVIGSMVLPSVPTQIAMGGYLPPRGKYMRFFAAQTQSLLGMLSESVSVLPADLNNDPTLDEQLKLLNTGLDNLRLQNHSLQDLMAGSTYDNLAIGKQSLLMSDQLDAMKKLLKKTEKRIKKISKDG